MSTSAAEDRSKRMIHTAGCIIIGDEVLGGKTVDTNSAHFAKYCFLLGMNLKRIEVIGDDEAEIGEAARRMSENYDFVVTRQDYFSTRSRACVAFATILHPTAFNGESLLTCFLQRWHRSDVSMAIANLQPRPALIAPNSHDDITYESIAKAFKLSLKLHDDALKRMKALSKPHPSQKNFSWDAPSPALDAKLRMVKLPIDESRDESSQALFVDESLWVPISVVNGNIHILPGIPRLFTQLLDGLKPLLMPRLENPEGKGVYRILFSTPMAESEVAGYLSKLAAEVEPKGVKVGSYPRWGRKRNSVTLVGKDKDYMESLVPQIEKGVDGVRVEREEDADESEDDANIG
ncbi:MAG: hypothetical protein LQ349_004836 [Xanthoria aureola]|nr:MAG: hypothetical protein LQ349_004836 [Xanthoria aureola]